jgi:2-polyprenyl-3-methyl-5-hydroxy-6-metoxy-1,4-benzoquinol methylase
MAREYLFPTIGRIFMKTFDNKKIVLKVEDDMNPEDIYCTTYQMRNFYRQFADGFFSSLDVMNYIQHHKAVLMMKSGDKVLDACCGRGLLLPMIRWFRKDINAYIGIDISETNINEQTRRSGIKPIQGLDYYPFDVKHIIDSVENLDKHIPNNSIDFIVYTSAIEHMQKEAGEKSLVNCYKVLKPGKQMFISCPNTFDKKDPYDTQYTAHLYEWDLDELTSTMKSIGFVIDKTFGLVGKKKDFDSFIQQPELSAEKKIYDKFSEYLPTPWLMAYFLFCFQKQQQRWLL